MKLSFLALVCALTTTTAYLRASTKAELEGPYFGVFGATIYLDHVLNSGDWDDETVVDAFVNAYNLVHSDDYKVTSSFLSERVDVPDVDGEHFYAVAWLSGDYESTQGGRIPPLVLDALNNPGVHALFVDEFCKELMQSGKTAFGGLQKCAIDFTYELHSDEDDTNSEHAKDETALEWGKHDKHDLLGNFRGEMGLAHVLGTDDGTSITTDVATISKAFIEAYNTIHGDTPYSVTGFDVNRIIQVPEDDEADEDDDEDCEEGADCANVLGKKAKRGGKKYFGSKWFYRGDFRCRFCEDRMMRAVAGEAMLTDDRHRAFELLFQHKLKLSGLLEYIKLKNAEIRFVYDEESPDGPPSLAQ